MKTKMAAISIRVPVDELKRIDVRARKLKLSRTRLLIAGALGELEEPDRLTALEQRVTALEAALEELGK